MCLSVVAMPPYLVKVFSMRLKMLERTVHYKAYGSWLRSSTCLYLTFVRRASVFQCHLPHIWQIFEVSVEQILSFLCSPSPYFLRISDLVQEWIKFTQNPTQLCTHYPPVTNKTRLNTSRAKEPLRGTKGKTDAPHSEEQIWDVEVEPGSSTPPNRIITVYVQYAKNKSHTMSLN